MKNALITGGSRGIGLAIAKRLSKAGFRVTICSRYAEGKQKIVEDIGNDAVWGHCDVQSPEEIANFMKDMVGLRGGFDILVNNAGGGGRWGEGKMPHEFDEWHLVFQKNIGATAQFTMQCLPFMAERGWGRIVTITSVYSTLSGCKPWFGMAKAAQRKLMQDLAYSQKYPGITFNSVAPGYINVEGKPIDLMAGKPDDVAEVVNFLCSDQAAHINGTEIIVDGANGL